MTRHTRYHQAQSYGAEPQEPQVVEHHVKSPLATEEQGLDENIARQEEITKASQELESKQLAREEAQRKRGAIAARLVSLERVGKGRRLSLWERIWKIYMCKWLIEWPPLASS